MCILLYMYCGRKANINMETFMLTGFKFESPQQYWIPDNHFMRLNVSCLLTAQRDFSYFETFWSEFKPENGQLVQNKADTKGSHPFRKVQFFLTLFKRPLTPPPFI